MRRRSGFFAVPTSVCFFPVALVPRLRPGRCAFAPALVAVESRERDAVELPGDAVTGEGPGGGGDRERDDGQGKKRDPRRNHRSSSVRRSGG